MAAVPLPGWSNDAAQAEAARVFCQAYLEAEDAFFNQDESWFRLSNVRDEKLADLLVACGFSTALERPVHEVEPGRYL